MSEPEQKITPEQKPPYTAREAAAALKISYTSCLRLIARKKIRVLPLRVKRIPRAELERFLREEIK